MSDMANNKKPVASELPPELYKMMEDKCKALGMSRCEYIRMLVYQDLKNDGHFDLRINPEVYRPKQLPSP